MAISSIASSLDFPVPEDYLGYTDNMVSNRILVVFWELVISAFSCIPNASGSGLSGNDSMYVK